MVRVARATAAAAAVVMLAGCAETVDEGVTDYRKATISAQSAQGAPTDISKKYALSDTTEYAGNAAIPINQGRRYYVSLLQAFVGPETRVGGTNWFHEHEQVALVLRVHDSNDRSRPGRLVFFTDDVKLGGQFLNFSNLLTIGPTEYKGGVVTIDVDEVHLRGTTNHIKELLQDLAEEPNCPLGAHAPSSGHDVCDDGPALGASDSAQSALVGPDAGKRRTWEARERDLFNLIDSDGYSTRYTLTLLPSGGIAGLPYPRFEAGNYVLMRHDKRDNAFEWDRLQLDNNTGRLVYAATRSDTNGQIASRNPHSDGDLNYQSRKDRFAADGGKPLWQEQAGDYREQSYVTLQINALDEPNDVAPPRVRSITQEQAIRPRKGAQSTGAP
ncbi:MAG: hypothetical protein KGJ78_11715 [Alphaproteobacteria bacterium]|nr:hypothetical protein [Alphaproteobacteria bacterium]